MIIEIKNIQKYYTVGDSRLHVLKDVSLDIAEAEFLALKGPSGAGKSTLLHIMGGLERPDYGSVNIEGEDIYNFNDSRISDLRNKKVGYVFQFYYLIPELNILENAALPLLIRGETRKTALKQAEEVLEFLQLKARITHYPNQISGGEQQRTAIARAIIGDPKILLCDEPTGNLDSQMGQEVLKLLQRINTEKKTTIIIVTHDEEVSSWAMRKIYMKDGVLIKEVC